MKTQSLRNVAAQAIRSTRSNTSATVEVANRAVQHKTQDKKKISNLSFVIDQEIEQKVEAMRSEILYALEL